MLYYYSDKLLLYIAYANVLSIVNVFVWIWKWQYVYFFQIILFKPHLDKFMFIICQILIQIIIASTFKQLCHIYVLVLINKSLQLQVLCCVLSNLLGHLPLPPVLQYTRLPL